MEVGQDMEVGASRATDRWRRAIAATLALWLLMLSTEPGSLNACVLHGQQHVAGAHMVHANGDGLRPHLQDAHFNRRLTRTPATAPLTTTHAPPAARTVRVSAIAVGLFP